MITKVRAKMSVQMVEKTSYSETTKFQCVMGRQTETGHHLATTTEQEREDNSFSSATPSGKMELQIDNKAVHGFFQPGKMYYIDITEVPDLPARMP